MNDERKQDILSGIREALSGIPEQYQERVCRALTHDIGVIKSTIAMCEKKAG